MYLRSGLWIVSSEKRPHGGAMRDEEPEIGGWKSEVSIRKSPLSRNSCRLRVSARTKLPSSCSSLTESRRRLAARLLRTNFTQITTLRTTCTMNVTCLRITSYVIVPRRAPPAAKREAVRKTSTQCPVRSAKCQVLSGQDQRPKNAKGERKKENPSYREPCVTGTAIHTAGITAPDLKSGQVALVFLMVGKYFLLQCEAMPESTRKA